MKSKTYVRPYLRGVGLLTLALFFPLIIMGAFAFLRMSVNVGENAWRIVWGGTVAAELAFLAFAAVQWKHAWALTLNHPSRGRVTGLMLLLAALLLGGIVVFIGMNLRNTCGC